MNNQMPFFYPFNGFQNPNFNNENYERLENKIERLEKSIRVLENKINQLENKIINNKKNDYMNDEPTDMYMI
jgi:predicted  nucleic acid-binding Zn-ribbon protein